MPTQTPTQQQQQLAGRHTDHPFNNEMSQSIVQQQEQSTDDASLLDIQKALVASEKTLHLSKAQGMYPSQSKELIGSNLVSQKNLKFPSLTEDNFYLSISPQKIDEKPAANNFDSI
jgi:hypothetical protein